MFRAVRILRLPNLLIAAFAVLLARHLAGGGPLDLPEFFSIAAALFLVAGFYVINDISDREIDAVNRPERPLAAGAVTVRAARLQAALLLGIAAGAAAAGAPGTFFWIASWGAALTAYEAGIKRRGLEANLLVSAVASSVLFFGAWLGGRSAAGAAPAVFAFLLHLGREVLKDVCDLPGDSLFSRATLAVTRGARGALAVSLAAMIALVLFSPVPFLTGTYNLVYLAIVLPGVDLVVILGMAHCLKRPDARTLSGFSRILKVEMWVGMAAMLLGSPGVTG